MLMYFSGLVLVTVASVQALTFNNPILGDTDYNYPGVIKVDGTYYVVAGTPDITFGIFPIHSSTDLSSWREAGYVFNGPNTPTWPSNRTMNFPEIHKIGSNYLVYFSAYNRSITRQAIGAAIAPHPLGPYKPINQPIMSLPDSEAYYPSIINDEGKLYLLWWESGSSVNAINARELNSNGMSFASEQTITLLKPSLTWEDGYVFSPWYIRRGNYHYLFYSVGCKAGVARSSHALGPYEKLPNPILVSNSEYDCTGYPSVVKDLDDEGHLIFFNAYRKNDADSVLSVLLASVSWDADDWPYVEQF